MELILTNIKTYKELAHEISHVIVNPIVKTLGLAIKAKNSAQQVHLLNLLQVILFECHFYSIQQARLQVQTAQNARELFTNQYFLKCICQGMKNSESFVRNAFIQFAIKVIPFMRDIVEAPVMASNAEVLLETFHKLLRRCDVSQYQGKSRHISQLPAQVLREGLVIDQEADIIMVVSGLKCLINNCLGIKDTQDAEMVEDIEDQLKDLGKQQ